MTADLLSASWDPLGGNHAAVCLPAAFEVTYADAIVLFDWLMGTDLSTVPITHPAQKQALTDLLSQLEIQADVLGATAEQIAQAQADVAKDMGW